MIAVFGEHRNLILINNKEGILLWLLKFMEERVVVYCLNAISASRVGIVVN